MRRGIDLFLGKLLSLSSDEGGRLFNVGLLPPSSFKRSSASLTRAVLCLCVCVCGASAQNRIKFVVFFVKGWVGEGEGGRGFTL